MIWLCGPYEEMSAEQRERLAKVAADGDALQEAINNQALLQVGQVLTVMPRREKDPEKVPPFVVINLESGNYMHFAGLFVYGADTREEALAEAVRVGQKNDMGVVDLEADD